jgi:prophage tail gpP-like protein
MLMGAQATSGSSVFDALNAVAAAEGGVMFVDGTGLLTMQGRSYRAAKTTADQTLTAQDSARTPSWRWTPSRSSTRPQ